MTYYTTTSTFHKSEISAKEYTLIWRYIIERSEKNNNVHIDKDIPDVV